MSVYGEIKSVANVESLRDKLPFPITFELQNGASAEIDLFQEKDFEQAYALFEQMMDEGRSWPFDNKSTPEFYRGYYIKDGAFVVRALTADAKNNIAAGQVLGTFYVKPNWPGRSSHICNGGFITHVNARRMGVATAMGRYYLRFAHALGYDGSMFNLVYANNMPSIKIWLKLGFKINGVVPRAGRLKGVQVIIQTPS